MFGLFKRTKEKQPVTLYNALTRKKEVFSPIDEHTVTLYSCGPTVYDFATIGNLRSYVFADTLKRVLQMNEYTVNHTMNLTDFGHLTDDADDGEDKMIKALKREEMDVSLENMAKIAERYTEHFKKDTSALNILPPSTYTPASRYVKEQIALIKTLFEKGYAYETSDGVYFEIEKYKEYGALGNIDVHALKEGARVEVNEEKRHPADFALWKKSDLGWESDWGTGFPGWHIECTAMVFATLGEQIDIHTGGIDHIPIHHNGEIAQAEAATGKSPFVRYWMHNAFITINENRIGKSEGNAITITELREKGYHPLAYRYWLLTAHYRSPINFTYEALEASAQALKRIARYILEHKNEKGPVQRRYAEMFNKAVNDDLDTPKAIALLWELFRDESVSDADKIATLKYFDATLGLGFSDSNILEEIVGAVNTDTLPENVRQLLSKRKDAREAKEYARSDELREKLKEAGYIVEDHKNGQEVRKI